MRRPTRAWLLALLLLVLSSGCARREYLQMRRVPRNPLDGQLQLLSRRGPQPTQRTSSLLRRYDLQGHDANLSEALEQLRNEIQAEPTLDKTYSYAELSYIAGLKTLKQHQPQQALDLFGASVAHAYIYLFDPRYNLERNPYDPQYRGACDIYNAALEAALRIVSSQGKLRPGEGGMIRVGPAELGLQVVLRGPWHDDEFAELKFVSEYEVKGLNNRHHSYGLGVPMIAVRRRHAHEAAYEQYYPPGLSFPVTAFLRVRPGEHGECSQVCVVELHDSLSHRAVQVADYQVPLETDLSTALAYSLQNPDFRERQKLPFLQLPGVEADQLKNGIFMVEPYSPDKIPVIMVHGLASSPLTWMEMFNDLRSFPEIRERFQFWFYLYPSGQPFWISARQFREDLERMRQNLDPNFRSPALGHMVLVGHSMGGLVSRMQSLESGDDFWRIISDKPLSELQATPEEREELARTFYFHPNPSIRRVITIGTPHRGSTFANDYTRWLSGKLIAMPKMLGRLQRDLLRNNPEAFRDRPLMTIRTSVDSLAPDCPILPVMLKAQKAPWVHYHNIVGVTSDSTLVSRFTAKGDTIVSFDSAHLDDVESEIIVDAEHTEIHRTPRAILEIRRVLLEHLREYTAETSYYLPQGGAWPRGVPGAPPLPGGPYLTPAGTPFGPPPGPPPGRLSPPGEFPTTGPAALPPVQLPPAQLSPGEPWAPAAPAPVWNSPPPDQAIRVEPEVGPPR